MEHSATIANDDASYGAARAIDLDLDTDSGTTTGSDGTVWLKLNLDKVHCVQQVMWYLSDGIPYLTWACTDTGYNCVGTGCNTYRLTVSTEGAVSDLSRVSDCKYGDTVKLKITDSRFNGMYIHELAIVEKPGKLYI